MFKNLFTAVIVTAAAVAPCNAQAVNKATLDSIGAWSSECSQLWTLLGEDYAAGTSYNREHGGIDEWIKKSQDAVRSYCESVAGPIEAKWGKNNNERDNIVADLDPAYTAKLAALLASDRGLFEAECERAAAAYIINKADAGFPIGDDGGPIGGPTFVSDLADCFKTAFAVQVARAFPGELDEKLNAYIPGGDARDPDAAWLDDALGYISKNRALSDDPLLANLLFEVEYWMSKKRRLYRKIIDLCNERELIPVVIPSLTVGLFWHDYAPLY